MTADDSLNQTKWECKYHGASIPKCLPKVLSAGGD